MMLSGSGAMETALRTESQRGSNDCTFTDILLHKGVAGQARSSLLCTQSQLPANKQGHISDIPLGAPLFVLRLSESFVASPSALMLIFKAGRKGWTLG